jgi:hypothetical protein
MKPTKNLSCSCTECGRAIEYPADLIGTTAQCPHCGKTTELLLETPPQEPFLPRRVVIWSIIAAVILLLGLAGVFYALKRSENWILQHKSTSGQTKQ